MVFPEKVIYKWLLTYDMVLERQEYSVGKLGGCLKNTYCGFSADHTIRNQMVIEFFTDLPYLRIDSCSQKRNVQPIYSIGCSDPVEIISLPWPR
jgi:hypothetical protein